MFVSFGSREWQSKLLYTSWSETTFIDIISTKFKAGVVFLINNLLQFTLGRFDAPHAKLLKGISWYTDNI